MFSQVFGILDSDNTFHIRLNYTRMVQAVELTLFLEEKMKPFTVTKIILGAIFYIVVMTVAGVLIYRAGWSSGSLSSGTGAPGAAMLASGSILAWSIGILAALFLASIPLRLMARRAFGMTFMHGPSGYHGHPMSGFGPGFGPGWGMRHSCSHHGPPNSDDMEKWFKKWEDRHGEAPEHWRKVAEAAVEARKADEDRSADPSENA
jgi:hypothetical protein